MNKHIQCYRKTVRLVFLMLLFITPSDMNRKRLSNKKIHQRQQKIGLEDLNRRDTIN